MTNKINNQQPDNPVATLSQISLSAQEKADMRQDLRAQIESTANRGAGENRYSYIWSRLTRGRFAISAAVVLFALGGITFAAQESLPGEPLYAVKTNINETFMSVTAVTDSQAAETQSRLAARRIDELQKLVENNNLTTSTSDNLLSDVAQYTQSARQEIAELKSIGEEKKRQAQELNSKLSAVLAVEGRELSSAVKQSTSSGAVSDIANQTAEEVLAIIGQTSDQEADTPNQLTESAAIDLLSVTTEKLYDAYDQYREANNTADTPPPQQLVVAAHKLESALKKIDQSNYQAAVSSLQSGLKKIQKARDWLETTSTTSSSVATENGQASSTGTSTAKSPTSSSLGQVSASPSSAPPTDTDQRLPTKQALHNETVQRVLESAQTFLSDMQQQRSKSATSSQPASTSTATSTGNRATSSRTKEE